MNKRVIALSIFFALFTMYGAFALEFNGTTVFINDSRAFISANPHTIVGTSYVEGTLLSKVYTGNINMILCYNGEYLKPRAPLYYENPHEEFGTHPNGTLFNYTERWSPYVGNYASFDVDYGGKTRCHAITGIPVQQGTTYHFRFLIEAPTIPVGRTIDQTYPGYDGKYDLAFYPSGYGTTLQGVRDAIQNNQFLLLDPVVNLTNELVFWYDFNNDLLDASPNGNHLALVGGASVGAIELDIAPASGDYVYNYSLAGLTTAGDHTLCFRENHTGQPGSQVGGLINVGNTSGTNNANFFYWLGLNPAAAVWNGGAKDYRYGSVAYGNVTNQCFVWFSNNNTLQRYLWGQSNGTHTGGTGGASNINISQSIVQIGSWTTDGNNNYQGYVDYIAYWNRALNATEISTLNNNNGSSNYTDFINKSPSVQNQSATATGDTAIINASFNSPVGENTSLIEYDVFFNAAYLESNNLTGNYTDEVIYNFANYTATTTGTYVFGIRATDNQSRQSNWVNTTGIVLTVTAEEGGGGGGGGGGSAETTIINLGDPGTYAFETRLADGGVSFVFDHYDQPKLLQYNVTTNRLTSSCEADPPVMCEVVKNGTRVQIMYVLEEYDFFLTTITSKVTATSQDGEIAETIAQFRIANLAYAIPLPLDVNLPEFFGKSFPYLLKRGEDGRMLGIRVLAALLTLIVIIIFFNKDKIRGKG